jgi:hypothetical protein
MLPQHPTHCHARQDAARAFPPDSLRRYSALQDFSSALHAPAPNAFEVSGRRHVSTINDAAWRLVRTLIRFGRRHVLLFISERSRLPVLLPAHDADRLALASPRAVSGTLMGLGVPTAAVEQERSLMSPIAIGPSHSRSLLGSLNEFAFVARADFITRRDRTLDAVAREAAEVPLISPFKGECASVVTRRLFEVG